MSYTVLLASQSAVKKQAVQDAFGDCLTKLHTVDAASGVPSQPVGKPQTQQGAANRTVDAILRSGSTVTASSVDFVIGIENGMWQAPSGASGSGGEDGWVDGACICVVELSAVEGAGGCQGAEVIQRAISDATTSGSSSSGVRFLWSDELPIPPLGERPFAEGPCGEWSELKDPHAVLTGGARPRSRFLSDALRVLVAGRGGSMR